MMSVLHFRFNLDTKRDAKTRQFEKRGDETISDQCCDGTRKVIGEKRKMRKGGNKSSKDRTRSENGKLQEATRDKKLEDDTLEDTRDGSICLRRNETR